MICQQNKIVGWQKPIRGMDLFFSAAFLNGIRISLNIRSAFNFLFVIFWKVKGLEGTSFIAGQLNQPSCVSESTTRRQIRFRNILRGKGTRKIQNQEQNVNNRQGTGVKIQGAPVLVIHFMDGHLLNNSTRCNRFNKNTSYEYHRYDSLWLTQLKAGVKTNLGEWACRETGCCLRQPFINNKPWAETLTDGSANPRRVSAFMRFSLTRSPFARRGV